MDESSKLPNIENTKSPSPVSFAASSEKNSETSEVLVDGEKPKGLGFFKFRLKFTKRILPIILMGLGVAFLTLAGVVTYLYVKESAVKIHDVRITNIADGSATVSWVSEEKSKGVVYYGESDTWTPIFTFAGKEREDDDRDVEFNKDGDEVLLDGGRKEYFTHHVTIEDLEPNTRYFFRIGTGVIKGFGSDSDGNEVNPIETAPVIESLSTPNPAYGRVFKFDGSEVEDGIVFYRIVKDGSNLSSTLSTTVEGATWSADLSNLRDVTLVDRMAFDEQQTHIVEFSTADGVASVDVSKLQYQPVNDVFLNSDQENFNGEEVKDRFNDEASVNGLVGKVAACQSPYRECCGPNSSRPVTVTCDSNDNPVSWDTGACTAGDDACGPAQSGGGGGGGQCQPGEQFDPGAGGCVCVAPGGCGGGSGSGSGSGGGTGGTGGGGSTGEGGVVATVQCLQQSRCCNTGGDCYCGSSYQAVFSSDSSCTAGGGTCQCKTGGTGGGTPPTSSETTSVPAGQCTAAGNCVSGDGPSFCSSGYDAHVGTNSTCGGGDVGCYCTPKGSTGSGTGVATAATGNPGCNDSGLFCGAPPLEGGNHCYTTTSGDASIEQYCCPYGKVIVKGKCILAADAATAEAGVDVEDLPACSSGSCPGNKEGTLLCNSGGVPQFCCKEGTSYDPNQQKCTSDKAESTIEYCKTNCCSDISLCAGAGVACEAGVCVDRTAGDLCSQNVGPCYSHQLHSTDACTTVGGDTVWCCPSGQEDKDGNGFCESPSDPVCGDSVCQSNENTTCPQDCSTGGVQGASDEAYTIQVTESGSYVLLSNSVKLTNKEVEVFVPQNGKGTIKFFADTNANGVRDEGEEYISEDLGIGLELAESEAVYQMNVGWNLIGLNSFPTEGTGRTAKALLERLNSQAAFITHIATYRDGVFLIFSQRNGIDFGNDFNILPGEAYFIRAYTNVSIKLRGNKYLDAVPVRMSNGWNLMSIVKPNNTLTAEMVLDSMISQDINADALSRYQSGLYTSVIKQNGELFGRDFNMVQTNGYFVRVKDGGGKTWTP